MIYILVKSLNSRIRAILQDEVRGRNWLVAAVVHDSIGYYTPLGAENLVNDYIQGETENYSERCTTSFHCDLEAELLHDISAFEAIPEEKQVQLVGEIREVKKMDEVSQTTFGLFYPTRRL